MTQNKYDTVFFDLDGTLVDSGEGVKTSFLYALEHFGIHARKEDIDAVMGPPLVYSFMNFFGFDEPTALKAQDKYREFYHDRGIYMNTVYDGIPHVLSELKKQGVMLCVATSKPTVFAEIVLKHHGLRDYFDHVCGSELDGTRGSKKEVIEYALDMSGSRGKRVAMVGDRKYDVLGGNECGLDTVGADFGYAEENELSDAGAKYVVSNAYDLLCVLTKEC